MAKSIKKNYIYNLILQVVNIVMPFITAPYLSRVLGVQNIGISSYTISIVSYYILVSNLGVSSFGQREIAMSRDSKKRYSEVFWNLFLFKLFLGGLSIIAYLPLTIFYKDYGFYFLILIIDLIGNIIDISWLFQGLEEYETLSKRNVVIKAIFTIAIFVFVRSKSSLWIYLLLYGVSILMSSAAVWCKLPSLVQFIHLKNINIFKYTKDTIIYFLPQIATSIYTVLDRTMLGFFDYSKIESGYYEQSYKIIQAALAVITSLNTVMSPRISYLYAKKKIKEIRVRLRKSLRFTNMIAIPIMFGIASVASCLVPWFFGNEYLKVIDLLILFSPIVLIIGLSNCLGGQCLTPCGFRAKSAIALWVGAFVNLICNFLLIPKLGSIGAAIGSLVAETVITVLYFMLSKKYVSFKKTAKDSFKYFASGIVMYATLAGVLKLVPPTIIGTFVKCLCGVLVYAFCLFMLKDELFVEYFNNIMEKIKRRR